MDRIEEKGNKRRWKKLKMWNKLDKYELELRYPQSSCWKKELKYLKRLRRVSDQLIQSQRCEIERLQRQLGMTKEAIDGEKETEEGERGI